jgi:hypothetical protein
MEAQSVGGGWSGVATGYPLVLEQTWWCLYLCVPHRHSRIAARAMGWKSSTYVRLPSFLSFFLSLCPSIRPSVSPSVHLSFFPSLTSPSSLAPFSVSLIYIFLVFFSGSHVIGLLSMCSNVHTTVYVQLLDFFLLPDLFANLHLKYMISNFKLFEGFFRGKWMVPNWLNLVGKKSF